MAFSFWAFFQDYGTGGLSSAGWIRPGHVDGGTLTWDHDAIIFPDNVWTYRPDYTGTGCLRIDPLDSRYIWAAACVGNGEVLFTRCYVYDSLAETWSDALLDLAFVGPSTPCVVDICFDVDGTCFLAVGGNGAHGLAGGVGEGGVYKSEARGTFVSAGSGHQYSFNSGNTNNPQSLTALDLVPTTESGTRVLYTAHTLTRENSFVPTGYVTSASPDDGTSWSEPTSYYNGNQFRIECLAVLRVIPGEEDLWYVADNSGTGAYSTSNLSARIHGSLAFGPTGGYGGGIFTSGSIAYPFADPDFGVAFPTSISTTLTMYSTSDGGGSWNGYSLGLEHAGFAYRGGRAAATGDLAAGVTLDNPSHNSELVFTEDHGATWSVVLAEETAIGLSIDFGTYTPPAPRTELEVLTFRDSRMFYGVTRFYVTGRSDTEIRDNATALASLFEVLSNGHFTGATGPYTTSPVLPTRGTDTLYQNIEERIRLCWQTADGITIAVEVPCCASETFLDDQESPSILNPALAAAAAGAITYGLSTRGGLVAATFTGAGRVMRGIRQRADISTLDPSETGTGE